jgi:endopolyphosphatase
MSKEKASAVTANCGWSKWSLGAILLCLPALAVYKLSNQLLPLIGSCHEPQESVTVEYLDFDVAEYKKLGLTPQRPVRVQGNHRSQTIHGRFLHITDIHPDEHYKEGSDIDNVCHRGKPGRGSKGASKYGDATLGCDTPMVLMNETMEWIRDNLRDKIDFVIWTGDNIRHDNDRKIPRTEMQIFDMNGRVARIFHDIFHGDALDPRHYDVPVIPSLGNNDVYPHNLFAPGPTLQTRELWSLWQSFIPEEQLHVFERGSYYFNEVIPNQLAVLSINTLYLFKANPLVDNCDNRKDPGFKLFQWLGVTLEELRQRGMKVWLSGHVPPIPKNYDITCYRKFVLWLHEYRDIIIGGVYGHMNMDHFIPVDAQKAYKSYHQSLLKQGFEIDDHFIQMFELEEGEPNLEEQYLAMGFNVSEPDLNVAIAAKEAHALGGAPTNKVSYMASVRETFYADVKSKKKSGIHSERYAITNVAASVIPTFNPGFRIWEYNITGIEERLSLNPKPWGQFFAELEAKMEQNDFDDEIEIMGKKKKKGEKKEPDISLPKPMPDDAELGPGYVPQTLSPLRFVQYYLDLKAVNGGEKPLEFEVEYTSDGEPYNMMSLLVDDFLTLARKLGKPLKNLKPKSMNEEDKVEEDSKKAKLDDDDLWETYVKFAFVSSGYHD